MTHAQMHHVEAPERVTRAVGVYEWTGELPKPTAARFVPVSLFIEGRFEDAGLYLARPIPFALQPGDVYALEHAGEPQGVLDLELAHRMVMGKALAEESSAGAWFGFGKFTPETAPKAPPLHPSAHLSKIEVSGGPNTPAGNKPAKDEEDSGEPHLGRRDNSTASASDDSSKSPSTGADPTGGSSKGSTPSNSQTNTPTAEDDSDRPTLRRRDPAQDATRRREAGTRSKTASVTAAGPALGDDPDRPTLSHGAGEQGSTPELTGLPANMHQAVAVSDATHHDNHNFARGWDSPAEHTETLTAMAALAKPQLAAYLATNQLAPSSAPLPPAEPASAGTGSATPSVARPAGQGEAPGAPPRLRRGVPQGYQESEPKAPAEASASTGTPNGSSPSSQTMHKQARTTGQSAARRLGRSATASSAPLTLRGEEIAGYTLSYGGLPTFVYTAAASVQPAKGAGTTTTGPRAAYITVVAQRLPTGELQVALSTATDSAHLDRTPRLRLVDAVDPDDSHRASLLFELRGASSRQFALYRLTSVHAEQTFTTASLE